MSDETAGSAPDPCAERKSEIDRMQAEFEQLWLAISSGGGDPARYRSLRIELGEKRIAYNRDCGNLVEDSSLPRSVTADWKHG
jgi:hypothetical protein